jgi:ABC-type nickel/cobalt efflux system permease component RcnA
MDANSGTLVLLSSSALIGVVHTLLGPDHYLPFVALGKARKWQLKKTLCVVALCGLGHVGASLLLGFIGALAGWSLGSLEAFESTRGELAACLLILFGLFYLIWAIRHINMQTAHMHVHTHDDGTVHEHPHSHVGTHAHMHAQTDGARSITIWSLFVIFVFGPCEALIPLLLFPALGEHLGLAIGVVTLFGLATVLTMLATVWILSKGLDTFKLPALGRYAHLLVGLVLLGCGTAIQLGL